MAALFAHSSLTQKSPVVSIENGFYYDFDAEHRFSDEDFEAIEKKCKNC